MKTPKIKWKQDGRVRVGTRGHHEFLIIPVQYVGPARSWRLLAGDVGESVTTPIGEYDSIQAAEEAAEGVTSFNIAAWWAVLLGVAAVLVLFNLLLPAGTS